MEEILAKLSLIVSAQAEQVAGQGELSRQVAGQGAQLSELSRQVAGQGALLAELSRQVAGQGELSRQVAEQGAQLAELIRQVARQGGKLAELRRQLNADYLDVCVATPKVYEEKGRAYVMGELETRFGLRAVEGFSPHRLEGEIQDSGDKSVEWDFRMPVTVTASPPTRPGKSADFIVYPSKSEYVRPLKPLMERRLTPTKATSATPHSQECHYVVVFEITTTIKWSKKLLARLEERLRVSLDCARDLTKEIQEIVDVCAVVGVVAPTHCQESIGMVLKETNFPLLHRMMTEGRFVWLLLQVSPSVGSASSIVSDL
jgi:uncharacterized coiled-coil protein SlyX